MAPLHTQCLLAVRPSQASQPSARTAYRVRRKRFAFFLHVLSPRSFSVYAPGSISDDTRTHPLQLSRSSDRKEREALVTCIGTRARLCTGAWTARRRVKVCAATPEAPPQRWARVSVFGGQMKRTVAPQQSNRNGNAPCRSQAGMDRRSCGASGFAPTSPSRLPCAVRRFPNRRRTRPTSARPSKREPWARGLLPPRAWSRSPARAPMLG